LDISGGFRRGQGGWPNAYILEYHLILIDKPSEFSLQPFSLSFNSVRQINLAVQELSGSKKASGGYLAVGSNAIFFHDLLERLTFEPALQGSVCDVPICLLQNMLKIGNGKLRQNLVLGLVIGKRKQLAFMKAGRGI
jgi:hypothetical protein